MEDGKVTRRPAGRPGVGRRAAGAVVIGRRRRQEQPEPLPWAIAHPAHPCEPGRIRPQAPGRRPAPPQPSASLGP